MLLKPFLNRAVQFSQVGPAECGVSVALGSVKSGWFGAGGSSTITLRPAAASCPLVSILVHDRPAAGVDEDRGRLHGGELVGADHLPRRVVERDVEAHHVGGAQELGERR
jgi:hypothetical protein